MNAHIRQIQNGDLKVFKSFYDGSGRQRVHVSLKGLSKVCKTYWLTELQQQQPETLERIKAEMQEHATRLFNLFKPYLK